LRGTRGCLVGMKDRPEVMLCLISTVNDRLVCLRNGLSLSDAALARGDLAKGAWIGRAV
jgi:hypothetical protein